MNWTRPPLPAPPAPPVSTVAPGDRATGGPSARAAGRTVRAAVGVSALAVLWIVAAPAPGDAQAAPAVTTQYEVYGIRFAGLHDFPVRELVLGADSTRRQDLAFIVWALEPVKTAAATAAPRIVLFDAGFYRDKFTSVWKPFDYSRPSDAIAKIGLKPEAITDIIISHVHWDHLDGVDLFPHARVWIQRAEYEHYIDGAGRPRAAAMDTTDAQMLARLNRAGRVTLVDGDDQEVIPGITVYTGGRHTYASQYIGVRTAAGVVILASDNAYTYENLSQHRPIAQTFVPGDSTANLQAQDRMRRLAADPRLILPGHDPEIFERFPAPGNGVAKIE